MKLQDATRDLMQYLVTAAILLKRFVFFLPEAFGERHVSSASAEGHVSSKGGFAAAFRGVAGVEEGPRESVFKDMADAVSALRPTGLNG
jgi:hypothetical protein